MIKSILILTMLLSSQMSFAKTYGELRKEIWKLTLDTVKTYTRKKNVNAYTVYFKGCHTPSNFEAYFHGKHFAKSYNKIMKDFGLKTRDTILVSKGVFRYRGSDCELTALEINDGLLWLSTRYRY